MRLCCARAPRGFVSWRLRFAPSAARGAVWGQLASASCHWEHGVKPAAPRGAVLLFCGWGAGGRTQLGQISSIGSRVAPSALCSIPKTLQGPPASPTRSPALRAPQAVLQGCSSQLPSALHPEGTQLCTAAALDAPCRPAVGSSCRWCSLLRVLRTNEQTNKLFLDGKIKAKVLPAALMVLEHLGVVKVFMEKL